MKPYVVSADIRSLLVSWGAETGFVIPEQSFFDELRSIFEAHMRRIFSEFDFISEEELSSGMQELVRETDLTCISLDPVYCPSDLTLSMARLVDGQWRDRGHGHRPNSPKLTEQFRILKESGLRRAVISDDVIFTGDMAERVVALIERLGIRVPCVVAGIAVDEGVQRLKKMGVEVKAVRFYPDVVDEVCERDFYPGVPMSGRLLAGNGNWGAPYVKPFGNPEKWASIPAESADEFSRFCIEQAVVLFEMIDWATGRCVHREDLDRKVFGLRRSGSHAEALKSIL